MAMPDPDYQQDYINVYMPTVAGVTKVSVTRCGNWCHSTLFYLKKVMTYNSHPLRFPADGLSCSVLKNLAGKKFTLSFGCYAIDGVTRGSLPHCPPPSDITV